MLCESHWDTTLFGLSSLRIYLTLLFENLPWYRAQEANEQVWGTRPLAGWVGVRVGLAVETSLRPRASPQFASVKMSTPTSAPAAAGIRVGLTYARASPALPRQLISLLGSVTGTPCALFLEEKTHALQVRELAQLSAPTARPHL